MTQPQSIETERARQRRYASFGLNLLIACLVTAGVLLACIFAQRDGYSHWGRRLLYFTQQSNIWMGVTCLLFAFRVLLQKEEGPLRDVLYGCKFVFTVSITVTGIIFCTLLAPFADFNPWMLSSVLTHVAVPALSILDLLVFQSGGYPFRLRHTFLALLPPLFYFLVAGTLCILRVDFGRGDAFPYFFMDFYSEVGLFGFKGGPLPQMGTVYWILFFILLIWGLSFGYYKACHAIGKGQIAKP